MIAVTHMRWPNDIRLAEEVSDVDLILGGHDHGYKVQNVDGEIFGKTIGFWLLWFTWKS